MGWPWKKKQPRLGDGLLKFGLLDTRAVSTGSAADMIPGYLEAQLAWERFVREMEERAAEAARVKRRRAIRRQIHRAAVWQA